MNCVTYYFNFTSVLFKVACHANPEAEKNLQDLNDKFLNTFLENFQKHQLKVMYHF